MNEETTIKVGECYPTFKENVSFYVTGFSTLYPTYTITLVNFYEVDERGQWGDTKWHLTMKEFKERIKTGDKDDSQ